MFRKAEGQRKWRLALLIAMIVAFLGPWTFDLIHVPSGHACSAPYIRLREDYCGRPLSGIWLYRFMVGNFINSSAGFVMGELELSEWMREFLFSLYLFIPLLPIFSTLLLILNAGHQRMQVFTIIAWCLALGISLLWGLNNYPKSFWAVWGVWLYIILTAYALILELKTYSQNRRQNRCETTE